MNRINKKIKSRDKDDFDIEKRKQLGQYIDIDEVDEIEDNIHYLKCTSTFYIDLLKHVRNLLENPDREKMEEISEMSKGVYDILMDMKNEAEEERGKKFKTTIFMDNLDLDEVQRSIVLMLYAKKGVGIDTQSATLTGEDIIHALMLLFDIPPEKSRDYLVTYEKLVRMDIIEIDSYKRRKRKKGRGMIERLDYKISEKFLNDLLDHRDIKPKKEKEDKSKEKKDGNRKDRKRPKRRKEEKLATKLDSDIDFEDVVLDDKLKKNIKSVLSQYEYKDKFFEEWNMRSITEERKGLNLLFTGPSGTGKTMTAKAVGNYLDENVYMASYNKITSKWFGNTEKNIRKIFDDLDENGVLLLDEADALISHRANNVSTYGTENRMVNLFLQELENHENTVVLTTNLSKNIDKAVERRIDLKVKFDKPDFEAREKIWDVHIPDELPLSDDVDVSELAEMYEFTGGQIKNVVMNAARTALYEGNDVVGMDTIRDACENEMEGSEVMEYSLMEDDSDVRGYA